MNTKYQSHTVCAQQNMNSNERNAKSRVASHQENLERLIVVTENAKSGGKIRKMRAANSPDFRGSYLNLRPILRI